MGNRERVVHLCGLGPHTGLAILDDDGIDDLAELGEAVTKGIVGGVPGETSDKQLAGPRDWRKSHG